MLLEGDGLALCQLLDDRAALFEVVVRDLVGGLDDVVVAAVSSDEKVVSITTE